jgi:Tol biopolymer transport system component
MLFRSKTQGVTLILLLLALPAAIAGVVKIERITPPPLGLEAGLPSDSPSISADGERLAFVSGGEIYVRDRKTGTTERVSVAAEGATADGVSGYPAISGNGQFVAFRSSAGNLVPGDTNRAWDVFVRDLQAGRTERVSIASDGAQALGESGVGLYGWFPSISADGQVVAFESRATNLAPGDSNGASDVFVRDLTRKTTERVSVAAGGAQVRRGGAFASISADGRFVAFASEADNLVAGDSNGQWDIFVRDLRSGTTERVSVATGGVQADGESAFPSISADGQLVAFQSRATNLAPGDTNASNDIFVRDRQAGTTERVSVAAGGAQANGGSYVPAISADGRVVAFGSTAGNLAPGESSAGGGIYVRDRKAATTERVPGFASAPATWAIWRSPAISADGNLVAFTLLDLVEYAAVRDRAAATTEVIALPAAAGPVALNSGEPAISDDGRYVAFTSSAIGRAPGGNQVTTDVYVRDRQTGRTVLVSASSDGIPADGASFSPSISGDGRLIAFVSDAGNLAPRDTNGVSDVFVRDWQNGKTELVSARPDGAAANGPSFSPVISGDGSAIAFASGASNLLADANDAVDLFARDLQQKRTELVSATAGGQPANGWSGSPAISHDGQVIAFVSAATNLAPGDTSPRAKLLVRDRRTGKTELASVNARGEPANGESAFPAISRDGQIVAFVSGADNLVAGDANQAEDVFVRDRQAKTTELASVAAGGGTADGPSVAVSLSDDGRLLVFQSGAANLVTGDTIGEPDIFVRDRHTGTTERVNVTPSGEAARGWSGFPAISGDGRFVAFASDAENLAAGGAKGRLDVFVVERE